MKKVLLPALLFMFYLHAASQPKAEVFRFEHTGSRAAIVAQNKVTGAKTVNDLIPYFPSKENRRKIVYHQVILVASQNGKQVSAAGINGELNPEQLRLLADVP